MAWSYRFGAAVDVTRADCDWQQIHFLGPKSGGFLICPTRRCQNELVSRMLNADA